jgi:predicted transcriptional regulator
MQDITRRQLITLINREGGVADRRGVAPRLGVTAQAGVLMINTCAESRR